MSDPKIEDLRTYKDLPEWTAQTLPKGLQRKHNTKEGTWARLTVLAGSLRFTALSEDGEPTASHVFDPASGPQLAAPGAWHKVDELSEDLRCQLSFMCEPARYLEKKYAFSPPHYELRDALPELLKTPGRSALDLGCGKGRNSAFLLDQGFAVTAVDKAAPGVEKLQEVQATEGLPVTAQVYDIHQADLAPLLPDGQVDHVVSTVVLQFLDPDRVPAILDNLQAVTRPGGLHLIIAPMTTEALPCPLPLPFLLKPGELRERYAGWELLRYEEALGHFHRRDPQGERYASMFCTMLAKKR